jgi:taurine dioxygenase
MIYTLTALTEHMGLKYRGLDLTEPVDPEVHDALNRAFAQYHVLVIRGQEFTPRQFIAAAELFGELQPHDKKELHVPGYPQINYVSNEQTVPGKRYISGETFHTDHSNHPAPPKATLLYPLSLPTSGGDTQFVNMHEVYEDLPDATKQRIDGLKAVHVYQSKYSPRELRPLSETSAKALPPPGIRPLVRTHNETGRKALYLNPVRIESVVGMPDEEALGLVAELMAHATQQKYEYRHQWQ